MGSRGLPIAWSREDPNHGLSYPFLPTIGKKGSLAILQQTMGRRIRLYHFIYNFYSHHKIVMTLFFNVILEFKHLKNSLFSSVSPSAKINFA